MRVMQFAHAAGVIDPWGWAYAGAVIGAVLTGLVIVRTEVGRRNGGRDAPVARIPRWSIAVGFVCGGSFGLGLAGLVERVV